MQQLAPRPRFSPERGADPSVRLAQARALDVEIRALNEQKNASEARIARRMAELEASKGYLELGFATLAAYAWAAVGWGSKKLEDLLRLLRRLDHLPLTREAFDRGELPWTKAVLVARAAIADPSSEARWLEKAKALDNRQLERKVGSESGEEPRVRMTLDLSLEEAALFWGAARGLEEEGFPDRRREAKLAELAKRALQGGSVGTSKFRAVLGLCERCGEASLPLRKGEEAPVGPATLERALGNAEVQDVSGRVSRTLPPRVERQVAARSKGFCEVPGCSNRAHLHFHHNRGWRKGHDPDTIFHLCSTHHQKGPHEGRIRIEGSWSAGVRFLLRDGTLLGTAGGPADAPAVPAPAAIPVPASAPAPTRTPGPDEDVAAAAPPRTSAAESASPEAPRGSGRREERRASGRVRSNLRRAADEGPSDSSPVVAPGARGMRQPARGDEEAFALKALQRLELRPREAQALLERALEQQPELRSRPAAEIVRAALLLIPGAGVRAG